MYTRQYNISIKLWIASVFEVVTVPHQDAPWFIYDEGMNNLEHYYKDRRISVQNI